MSKMEKLDVLKHKEGIDYTKLEGSQFAALCMIFTVKNGFTRKVRLIAGNHKTTINEGD